MDTATLPTPSGTTETPPPAAPATSAPSPSPTPGQRPTFEQVFAADAAQSPQEPAAQPDGATTPPAATPEPPSATPPSTETTQGPIPFAVHKTALDNARTKAAQEATQQFEREYGWAKQVPRETLERMSGIATLMTSNPSEFLQTYFAEAANHPVHGAAVRSWAARTLASKSPAAVDLSPDVAVHDASGREVAKTFSAERVQAIVQHAVQDAIGKEIAPLKQDADQRKAQEQQQAQKAHAAEARQQLEAQTDAIITDLSDLLEITDATSKDDREALFAELNTLLAADKTLTPHRAAMQVRKTRIVPALAGKAQTKVLDDLKTKAASQGMNPGAAAVAPTHRPKSFNDPSLQW